MPPGGNLGQVANLAGRDTLLGMAREPGHNPTKTKHKPILPRGKMAKSSRVAVKMQGQIFTPEDGKSTPFGTNELAAVASKNREAPPETEVVDEGPFDIESLEDAGDGDSGHEVAVEDGGGRAAWDVVVVGGGAAGVMAALEARSGGARVVLLEKEERLGKKILISGGGKCNLTHAEVGLENYHGTYPRFVQDVLRAFDEKALVDWIESLGVKTWTDPDTGKVWPVAMKSRAVTDALEVALRVAGVSVWLRAKLDTATKREDGRFELRLADGRVVECGALVMASGGRAAPQLGANASGLAVVEGFGHKLVPQFPGLVGLATAEGWTRALSGVTCEDVELTLEVDGKPELTVQGDLLFTHYGINSPAVFRLSREVEPALAEGKTVRVLVNFRPDLFTDPARAMSMVDHALGGNTKKQASTVVSYIVGIRRLGDALLQLAGIEPEKRVREIQHRGRGELTALLSRCPLTVTATQGWARAEVMRGGVEVRKVNPKTMESKVVPGLFICGEMLDIDADVGGFNFQFAFASGKAAGRQAAIHAGTLA